MGTMIRNMIIGIFILGVGLGLFLLFDSDLREAYNIDYDTGTNASSFVSSNASQEIITETAELENSLKALTVSAGFGDIVGALMAVATGALNNLLNFISLPTSFLSLFVEDYGLPKQIVGYVVSLMFIVFSFILLSAKLRNEV